MRILISVDMEGISGVTRWQDVIPQGQDYQRARSWMTGDVNAAVSGARAGGATEFVVEENHGVEMLCNLVLDEIDPAVDVVRGLPRNGPTTIAALEAAANGEVAPFDALFLVGHHAKAGDRPGIGAHTISYESYKAVRVDGRAVSEGEIFAIAAAQQALPTALIAGDDVVAAELTRVVPGIETAVVKRALSRTGGWIIPPVRAQGIIHAAAQRATERVAAGSIPVIDVDPPFSVEVELRAPLAPEPRAAIERDHPEYEIDGDRTLCFRHEEMSVAYRMMTVCGVLAEKGRIPRG